MSGGERFTARLAVYLILIQEGKILLARRFQTGWMDGYYSLPAGHLDGKETVAQAMSRETAEEVGLTVLPKNFHVVHVVHHNSDVEYIDFYLTVDEWSGKPQIMEPDKCDDLQWFELDNLPENTVENVKEALEKYRSGIFFSEFGLKE